MHADVIVDSMVSTQDITSSKLPPVYVRSSSASFLRCRFTRNRVPELVPLIGANEPGSAPEGSADDPGAALRFQECAYAGNNATMRIQAYSGVEVRPCHGLGCVWLQPWCRCCVHRGTLQPPEPRDAQREVNQPTRLWHSAGRKLGVSGHRALCCHTHMHEVAKCCCVDDQSPCPRMPDSSAASCCRWAGEIDGQPA